MKHSSKPIVNTKVNKNVYHAIVKHLADNKSVTDVALILGVPKQNLTRRIGKLKREGVIKNIGKGTWEVNEAQWLRFQSKVNTRSIGTTTANLHALHIKIPIVDGTVDLKGYESKLNNWNVQYKKIPAMKLTLKNNNNRSLSVYVWSREVHRYNEIPNICHITVHQVCSMFKGTLNLDYLGWEVKTLHLAMRDKELDQVFNKGTTLEVALGRSTEKITENDITREAKAWTDNSPFRGIETNDIAYYKNYLMMPENVANNTQTLSQVVNELIPAIKLLETHMRSHTGAIKGINQSFKRFNDMMSQKSLLRYL